MFVEAVWLWYLWSVVSVVWFVRLWSLVDWFVDAGLARRCVARKPVAGLVEFNVGAVYGWCINSK